MLGKNKWLGGKYESLFTTSNNRSDLNISWSSTDSDEDYRIPKKKFKSDQNTYYNFDVKSTELYSPLTSSENFDYNNIDETVIVSNNSQFTCETVKPDSQQDKPSLSSNHSFKESPIIGGLPLVKLSPVHETCASFKTSPVIGSSSLFHSKLRKPTKDKISSNKESTDPQNVIVESDSSNSSEVIGEDQRFKVKKVLRDNDKVDSNKIIESWPSSSQRTHYTISSNSSPPLPLDITITPILSQECVNLSPTIDNKTQHSKASNETVKIKSVGSSQGMSVDLSTELINRIFNENEEVIESPPTSSNKSSLEQLYHEISPKKKKKYKKNGFADQLQKALRRQHTDFAIWRHEMFLQKLKDCNTATMCNKDSILYIKIINFWKELGVTVMECEHITNEIQSSFKRDITELPGTPTSTCNLKSNEILNQDHSKKCLVIIGFNVVHHLRIKPNAKFKLCMPYKTKFVEFNNELVACYFNVSRILSFK